MEKTKLRNKRLEKGFTQEQMGGFIATGKSN
jgi:hypothetical protein